jgi:hypothetical protein
MFTTLETAKKQVTFDHCGLVPQKTLHVSKKPHELGLATEKAAARLIECLWKGHEARLYVTDSSNIVAVLQRLTASGTVVNLLLGNLIIRHEVTRYVPEEPGVYGFCPSCEEAFGQIMESSKQVFVEPGYSIRLLNQ